MEQKGGSTQKKRIIVYVDSDLEELIPGFLENRHNDIASILNALKEQDYETIRLLGHSMKGSGVGYGFDVISDIGRSLEQAAKDRDMDDIKHQLGLLSKYLESIDIVYK
jgi:HPt (histidine-containing phosphotransfer) domain-containing protein